MRTWFLKSVLMTTYLLQQDVFVDDSLVPLRVDTLAGMFGPPLVFSTGGEGVGGAEAHHSEKQLFTDMQEDCFLLR